jgi:hypothetical protein
MPAVVREIVEGITWLALFGAVISAVRLWWLGRKGRQLIEYDQPVEQVFL